MAKRSQDRKPQQWFSIGEWYGRLLTAMNAAERQQLAQIARKPKNPEYTPECPFRGSPEKRPPCTKRGGVCTLRLYQVADGRATPAPDPGVLRTVCPHRFREDNKIFAWVGEKVLGHPEPHVVEQVPFLQEQVSAKDRKEDKDTTKLTGRIDMILIHPDLSRLSWCALETQAVYFSGKTMDEDFARILSATDEDIPFAHINRRPDYRSSTVKRLLPQLQTKVQALMRWEKKLAVVTDYAFYNALGDVEEVNHISNCDIVWFVVNYDIANTDKAALRLDSIHYTTLEKTVSALTGRTPLPKEDFEKRIIDKLNRQLKAKPAE